ncbi:MAG TPA: DUF4193 domain-containing protein [Arthrobacter sp.]|jgi:hypothetical protein
MSIDYDAPRLMPEEEPSETLDGLKTEKTATRAPLIDLDETDLADSFVLPGADLSHEELLVQVVPVQSDEFTCMSCFLVHHRSQLARVKDGKMFCTECES